MNFMQFDKHSHISVISTLTEENQYDQRKKYSVIEVHKIMASESLAFTV